MDCADALARELVAESSAIRVGGRLVIGAAGELRLASGGAEIAFVISPDCIWNPLCLRKPNTVFDASVIRGGDLISVDLRLVNSTFVADQVSLLFAADDPKWSQRSSDPFHLTYSMATADSWERCLDAIRGFFKQRTFKEMLTPTLVPSPGTEPFLEPFATQVTFACRERQIYLPTSPEFHLKKLLAAGWTRIFELKTCFRNNEGGRHHQPEFTMLEWYRAYADLDAIAVDCENLFSHVARALGCDDQIHLSRVSVAALFQKHLNFALGPDTEIAQLRSLAKANEIVYAADDSWDDLYFRIFLTRIEPHFQSGGPWLVHDYPPSQAALARLNPRGWADRFEIYWRGLEIANAFHELNDPEANVARFAKDRAQRQALGKPIVPNDEELLRALFAGMPPAGGIALGVDRLFMAVLGKDSIEETRPFPFRP